MATKDFPKYQVRISKRAKRARIVYHRIKGLSVVVPVHLKINPEKLVADNRGWIEKQVAKYPSQAAFYFPSHIYIDFLGLHYAVTYRPSGEKMQYREAPNYGLTISGMMNEMDFKSIMKAWLIGLAKRHLIPYLASISETCNLPYNRASVRGQSTIWGSCSAKRNISMNYKLLFLPKLLVRYVLVHELCHTVHLNHGKSFWRLVEKHDAHYLQHKKAIREREQSHFSWLGE